MDYVGGARVKKERRDKVEEGAVGWSDMTREFTRTSREAKDHLRESVVKMAKDVSMTPSSVPCTVAPTNVSDAQVEAWDINNNGGAHRLVAVSSVKTPKYSDDALSCLLLLSLEDRHNYAALVGALQRWFGQCLQPGLLHNELSNWCRKSGKPLRVLANNIASLMWRAYAHMPPMMQSELARDQFIRALLPTELRVQVQLQHLQSLQAALEMVVERENVWGVAAEINTKEVSPAVRAAARSSSEEERVAWVAEVTELIRAVMLQTASRPCPAPRVCWGCGQPGHLVRECPKSHGAQGNGLGRGSQAPLSPEADDNSCLPVAAVGRTSEGDSCYIPVIVEGVPCPVLVDTGSMVTLMRPEVVLGWTQLEPTTVRTSSSLLTALGQQHQHCGWHLCADYRPVNGVTKKDSYPLPRIDESLDLVSGSYWIFSLDLHSGYCQVPLALEARPKTSFCTGQGLWQFKVLSFGLCNAPAIFIRLMDKVLAGVPHQQCLVYLDDILVHGRSFEAALASLQLVVERIRAAGLKLHPKKCHFMQREVTFLGHKVGGEGIGTMQEKKDRDFVWTEQCQRAFNSLWQALSEAPVLAPADPTLLFILDTDTRGVGVGGVLSQVGPEGERVVAYFSRAFSKAERHYCITCRELLAVMLSIRHFKYYLCGLVFTVRTDHSALQWLVTFKEPEGQLARWLEELQAFNFNVEHRAGARHTNADALSRGGLCCSQVEEFMCRELQAVDLVEWKKQQEQDAKLQPVLQWVEAQRQPLWEEVAVFPKATKGLWSQLGALRLCQGVLQQAWKEPATGEERWQVVFPKDLQETVLKAMHGATGSGHFGVTKTLHRLRQGFYWGQCRRDVEDFCCRCDPCTACKGPMGRSHAPFQQFPVGAPMERVAVDVVGPLPRSDRGNHYVLSAIDYFTKWPEAYCREQQQNAGVRQKQNYDVKGRHFWVGELVWVFSPQMKKGRCLKLNSQWAGPCKVLERLREVIYQVQLPSKGRKLLLHRDRLAPYRGGSSLQAEGMPVSPHQPSPSHPAQSPDISPGIV
ncbi:hypothetical protein LDENG_00063000 [Lucifuga dentata]|nr:hypothetical protein LDENG_00063000 [Lucifuga dentata]